jgi:exopolysaccharide production protein ExoQ
MDLTLGNYSQKIPWTMFFLLALSFSMASGHDFYYSLLEHYDQTEEFFIEGIEEGNIYRRIGVLMLGLIAIVSLVFNFNRITSLKINVVYVWLILLFIAWCLASVLWSIDASLTLRRLSAFIVFWLTVLALVSRYSVAIIPYCTLFISGIFLAIGLLSEIFLGTFHPFDLDYRFSGTVHPNVQGVNCALMFISAAVIAGESRTGLRYALPVAAFALTALFLTKSRNSFASSILAVAILWGFMSFISWTKIFIMLSFILLLFLIVLLAIFIDSDTFSILSSFANLGRDSSDVTELNGRIEIWSICLDYIFKRPFLGYGFNSFWNSQHIYTVSSLFGAGLSGAHSAYIELALNIGIVGATIFTLIVVIGIKKSLTLFKRNGNIGYSFCFVLFTFYSLHGLLESQLTELGYGSFLMFWGLASLAFTSPFLRAPSLPNKIVLFR